MNPSDYGDKEVDKISVEGLFNKAKLSQLDREIISLRCGQDWMYKEIADYIGMKYFGRTEDNPLWEGSVRYRVKKIMKKLRDVAAEKP